MPFLRYKGVKWSQHPNFSIFRISFLKKKSSLDISVVYFSHSLALTMADLDKYSKMAEMDVDDDDEDISDTDDPDLLVMIIGIFRQSVPKICLIKYKIFF